MMLSGPYSCYGLRNAAVGHAFRGGCGGCARTIRWCRRLRAQGGYGRRRKRSALTCSNGLYTDVRPRIAMYPKILYHVFMPCFHTMFSHTMFSPLLSSMLIGRRQSGGSACGGEDEKVDSMGGHCKMRSLVGFADEEVYLPKSRSASRAFVKES